MNQNYSRTKIVATVGPACNTKEKLLQLAVAGVNVFRLNFSHGSHEDKLAIIEAIKELNNDLGFNLAILQDLQGPKIRVGSIENGSIVLNDGDSFTISIDESIGRDGRVSTTYKNIVKDVKVGDTILMDDGQLKLEVVKIKTKAEEVITRVIHGGLLKEKKGINLPDTDISLPALTQKDKEDLAFGLEQGVHWIAISFVRRASEIMNLKTTIADKNIKVIAKIERPEAIKHIDSIIDLTDGVMVARGDLGVEMDFEQLPVLQKTIIQKARKKAKPVIVATQMMESMIENFRPTRAEAVDVANAITDGADAVMLSAETATGKYPTEVIKCMKQIIKYVESNANIYNRYYDLESYEGDDTRSSLVLEIAAKLSSNTNTHLIASISQSGFSARRLSSFRPEADIIIYTPNKFLLCALSLVWGIRTFVCKNFESTDEAYAYIEKHLKENNIIRKGDIYINTSSMPLQHAHTNNVRINETK